MKKTKFFSRIFAAVLAAAVLFVPLSVNGGAGLLAFAGASEEGNDENDGNEGGDGGGNTTTTTTPKTYSVKIISPDVPANGTYRYDFYQIIAGNVEEDDESGKNIISNHKWGSSFLGMDDVVVTIPSETEGESTTYTRQDALLNLVSTGVIGEWKNPEGNYYFYAGGIDSEKKASVFYGYSGGQSIPVYSFTEGATYYPRSAEGLVNLLNDIQEKSTIGGGSNNGFNAQTAYLRTLADLLLNGGKYDETSFGFLKATDKSVTLDKTKTEYEVDGLEPGYYLVVCVDAATGKPTNSGVDTAIKPASAMWVMVGPANDGVAEIVGKNATSVPTINLQIYNQQVGVTDLAAIPAATEGEVQTVNPGDVVRNEDGEIIKIYDANYSSTHNCVTITDLKDHTLPDGFNAAADWSNTQSFTYEEKNSSGYILYRVGITLPQNFDSYKDSGYVLAFVNSYGYVYSGSSTYQCITRLTKCRPQVYVEHSDGTAEYIGSLSSSTSVSSWITEPGAVGQSYGTPGTVLAGNGSNNQYNIDNPVDQEIFSLGNLYSNEYMVTDDNGELVKDEDGNTTCKFKPGDKIYIYYPAYLTGSKYSSGANRVDECLLNPNRVQLVYSNDPYAEEEIDNSEFDKNKGFNHHKSGALAVSKVVEANVNNYNITLKVSGSDGNYEKGAQFALYRINKTTGKREYAVVSLKTAPNIVEWLSQDDDSFFKKDADDHVTERYIDEDGKLIVDTTRNAKYGGPNVLFCYNDSFKQSVTLLGLGAGEYYLEEIALNVNNSGTYDAAHDNIKKFNYHLAQAPFKLVIENTYNDEIPAFTIDNIDKIIETLTITFEKGISDDRFVNAYINKFSSSDTERQLKSPQTSTLTSTTTTAEDGTSTTTTTIATNGRPQIEVEHVAVNLLWLPETGGIGTMIFFIVGGAIVVTATVLIVTRFRVKRQRL